jgi:hypothetical protein
MNIAPRPAKNANLLFEPAGEKESEQLFRHKMNYENALEDEDPTGVRDSMSRTSSIASDPGPVRSSNTSRLGSILDEDEEEEEEDDEVNLTIPSPPPRNNVRPQNTLTRTGVLVAQPRPPTGPKPGVHLGGSRKTRKHRKTRKQRKQRSRKNQRSYKNSKSRKHRKH